MVSLLSLLYIPIKNSLTCTLLIIHSLNTSIFVARCISTRKVAAKDADCSHHARNSTKKQLLKSVKKKKKSAQLSRMHG